MPNASGPERRLPALDDVPSLTLAGTSPV